MTPDSPRHDRSLDRRTFLAGLGASAATGVVASGATAGDGATDGWRRSDPPTPSGTFVSATTEEATTINPLRAVDEATEARVDLLFDGPGGRFGPDTLDPRWLESWEINDSYDRVEYTLRDGLEWGAGYGRLDAEDYLYCLENIVLPTGEDRWYIYSGAGEYQLGPDLEPIEFEKTGELSFVAELPVSKSGWFHEDPVFDLVPLPRGLLEQYVPDQDREGIDDDPAVTEGRLSRGNLGPYEFESWERGSTMAFTRNEDYYLKAHADEAPFARDPRYDFRNAPYYDRYEVQVFEEESAALSALETDDVQSAPLGPRTASEYEETDGVDVYEQPFDDGLYWLNLNHRINGWAPIRESRQVRRALTNLYDAQAVVEEVYDGNARPTTTFHPEWGPYYPDADARYEPEGTVERARELLAAGTSSDYGYDDDGRFVGPDGTQVTLTAVRSSENPSTERTAEYMASRLDAVGIDLEVTAVPWSDLLRDYAINSADNVDGVDEPEWTTGGYNGGPWDQSVSNEDWDLLFGLGFSASPYAPWGTVRDTIAEKGPFNIWGYTQDEYDVAAVTEDASTTADPERATELMTDLFGFLSREVPLAWTQSEVTFTAHRDEVANYPGEETAWGSRATGYFTDADAARLTWYEGDGPGTQPTPTLSLAVDRDRIGADGTVPADVVLSAAPNGLAGFELDVSVAAPEVATITDARVADALGIGETTIGADGDRVTLRASDLESNVESGATDVTVATVEFAAENAGTTDLTVSVTAVDDDTGAPVQPETATGTLAVAPVERIGDNPLPTDPDEDGVYEDLNGNGRTDYEDVVLFFENKDSDAITEHADAYDFNDNGRIDFDDLNELFEEI